MKTQRSLKSNSVDNLGLQSWYFSEIGQNLIVPVVEDREGPQHVDDSGTIIHDNKFYNIQSTSKNNNKKIFLFFADSLMSLIVYRLLKKCCPAIKTVSL
jgi:hypothetical protein